MTRYKIMKEEKLVRCRPCGYVMKESDLGDVCPACGLPHTVFEPYREKVSPGRIKFLGLDIHPIAIHLSQTFVALIPGLIVFNFVFPGFYPDIFHSVILFSVFVFPITLILSFISGIADGIARFKTLSTPLLRSKMIFSIIILILSIGQLLVFKTNHYTWYFFLLSVASLAIAVKLGMMGKHLINVILPGTLVMRKKTVANTGSTEPKPKMSPEEIERLKAERLAAKQAKETGNK